MEVLPLSSNERLRLRRYRDFFESPQPRYSYRAVPIHIIVKYRAVTQEGVVANERKEHCAHCRQRGVWRVFGEERTTDGEIE